jgi:hypothetical protein
MIAAARLRMIIRISAFTRYYDFLQHLAP